MILYTQIKTIPTQKSTLLIVPVYSYKQTICATAYIGTIKLLN